MKKDSHYKSGRANICKSCFNLRQKDYKEARHKAYIKYSQTEKGKAAIKRAYTKYAKTDKGKAAREKAQINFVLRKIGG